MLSLQGEHTLLQTVGSLEPMVSMARWLLRLKVKILAIWPRNLDSLLDRLPLDKKTYALVQETMKWSN